LHGKGANGTTSDRVTGERTGGGRDGWNIEDQKKGWGPITKTGTRKRLWPRAKIPQNYRGRWGEVGGRVNGSKRKREIPGVNEHEEVNRDFAGSYLYGGGLNLLLGGRKGRKKTGSTGGRRSSVPLSGGVTNFKTPKWSVAMSRETEGRESPGKLKKTGKFRGGAGGEHKVFFNEKKAGWALREDRSRHIRKRKRGCH